MDEKYKSIDGYMFKNMLTSGYRYLEARKKEVDALNIFPVPDGDTGINMTLTIDSANKYAQKVIGGNIGEVSGAASTGSLFGARGNSGVILSQIMRGIAKGLENLVQADAEQLAQAFKAGVESAYKAVMRPVEGTILTVSSELAKGALSQARSGDTDVVGILRAGYNRGQLALKRTPDLLPALKQAGVVDAGGFGFLLIIEGWIAALENNQSLPKGIETADLSFLADDISVGIMEITDLTYPYCTEFLVKGEKLDEERVKRGLIDQGDSDSLLVVGTTQVVKIHVHTANPGRVLEYAIGFGSLHEVKIHNMLSQNEAVMHAKKQENPKNTSGSTTARDLGQVVSMTDSTVDSTDGSFGVLGNTGDQEPGAKKEYGMTAVVVGDGIAQIFQSLGADQIIPGGQTMNPSAQDIVEAVKTIPAENVFVFPNNGNIIMAARQANELINDQNIIVIPSRSIAQGIAGMLEFNLTLDVEQNEQAMTKALSKVGSGEVTYAVRDWESEGIAIKSGDVLGLVEDKIVSCGTSVVEVAQQVLEGLKWRERSLVTLFYGEETQQADIDCLSQWLATEANSVETEIYEGKQPLYYFIIGVD